MRFVATLLAIFCMSFGSVVESMPLVTANRRVQQLAVQAGVAFPIPAPEIRIHKLSRTLELWSSSTLVKRYVVGLGIQGTGDKRQQGDHLTPEGNYYICNRNDRSQFHLFLGLSYPGEEAADRGIKAGLITRAQRDAICKTVRAKGCPPWNTRLGGAVGIHGGGSTSDWTWGCIALEDTEIEELWITCPLGTPVLIKPD
jgi:murein L,D-transpeptidase YafK